MDMVMVRVRPRRRSLVGHTVLRECCNNAKNQRVRGAVERNMQQVRTAKAQWVVATVRR